MLPQQVLERNDIITVLRICSVVGRRRRGETGPNCKLLLIRDLGCGGEGPALLEQWCFRGELSS